MDGVALGIGYDLHLHMARPLQEFLHQHMLVAEGALGLALRARQRIGEFGGAVDPAHALAAAASRRLDQHWIADLVGRLAQGFLVLGIAVIARQNRNFRLVHRRLGRALRAHGADGAGRRADKGDAVLAAGHGEGGVLRQEAVTGMDRIDARAVRRVHQGVDVEIALRGGRRAEPHGFIRRLHMQGIAVGIGIDGHRADAHLPRRADDPAGDLAAIGDQDFPERGHGFSPALRANSACAFRGRR